MAKKILHISGCDKFIPPFVEFIKEHFDFKQHEFLLTGGMAEQSLIKASNVHLAKKNKLGRLNHYFKALIKMHQADKIILHGLFDTRLVFILFFTPWLLKKCYWVLWGGDYFDYKFSKRSLKFNLYLYIKKNVVKRVGYLITYMKGSVDLVRCWYGAGGVHLHCIAYLSNVYETEFKHSVNDEYINILIGNSATETNRHIKIFEKIIPYYNSKVKIYCPLSYGNQEYRREVIEQGRKLFGKNFIPLVEFLNYDDYFKIISKVDIAIFYHNRQQAMGNTISLLGMGKKVYMNHNLSSWDFFCENNIEIFAFEDFDGFVKKTHNKKNHEIISSIFSRNNLIKQWGSIFNE